MPGLWSAGAGGRIDQVGEVNRIAWTRCIALESPAGAFRLKMRVMPLQDRLVLF
jgi:hypothetical protein